MTQQTRSLEMSLTIDAPAATVYQALTDEDTIGKWFASKAISQTRVGGELILFFVRGRDADSDKHHFRRCRFRELVPHQRIAFSWPAGDTNVTIDLREDQGRTTLHLRHEGWQCGSEHDAAFEGHSSGWTFFLNNLKSFLEEDIDNRMDREEGVLTYHDPNVKSDVERILQRLEREALAQN